MTRILPLIPLMLWLSWSDQPRASVGAAPINWLALLWVLAGIVPTVAVMSVWARMLVRSYLHSAMALPTRRFHLGMLVARLVLIAWYGVALYLFGFGRFVDTTLQPLAHLEVRLPGLILGTWPALLGWVGLWWAAYPVERAVREQNLLSELDRGLNVHAPPSLRDSLISNFRMQVLFMLAPVLAVVTLRDLATVAFYALDVPMTGAAEVAIFVGSILLVFIASPELLVRVLRARPLPDSPLRRRLESMADRLGLKYRDILLWHTSYGVGNAAVMGLVPRFRYILLTDLLIETLDEPQIEAVFAHEAGHVQHRHLLWYVVFMAIGFLSLAGPGEMIFHALNRIELFKGAGVSNVIVAIGMPAIFLILFGMLARLFEKQADVYAARSIQLLKAPQPVVIAAADMPDAEAQAPRYVSNPLHAPVGPAGAESFVSALCRVADINHMPIIRARRRRNVVAAGAGHLFEVAANFMHPSIPDRVDHLRHIAVDPRHTARFDSKLTLVMLGMLFLLVTLTTWVCIAYLRNSAGF